MENVRAKQLAKQYYNNTRVLTQETCIGLRLNNRKYAERVASPKHRRCVNVDMKYRYGHAG
jgi:hypothetical protein